MQCRNKCNNISHNSQQYLTGSATSLLLNLKHQVNAVYLIPDVKSMWCRRPGVSRTPAKRTEAAQLQHMNL